MLNLLLADAEIELIPRELFHHPSVKANAKRRGKPPAEILLDSTIHHSALRKLTEGERRGRPDLVHFYLLLALESIMNKRGLLKTYIHTRNDEFITVNPSTRIPKNYNRFVGLMESLLLRGSVPPDGDPLLQLHRGYDLKKCLEELHASKVMALSEEGTRVCLDEHFSGTSGDALCIIGGFPKGDFKSDLYVVDEIISISEEHLTVWTVTSEVLVNYENSVLG
jgi:rRNA small subunit pseudouridine methyltransferase Nep1